MDMNRTLMLTTLLALALSACAGATETPSGPPPRDGGPPLGGGTPLVSAVYITSTDLLIAESYPVQVSLHITGDLPTPCHEFQYQYEIQIFGEVNRVDLTAFSVSDPAVLCTQVLEPFEARIPIPLEDAPDGEYEVYLNGELVGEFTYPGG
jgi:hypothetical protein